MCIDCCLFGVMENPWAVTKGRNEISRIEATNKWKFSIEWLKEPEKRLLRLFGGSRKMKWIVLKEIFLPSCFFHLFIFLLFSIHIILFFQSFISSFSPNCRERTMHPIDGENTMQMHEHCLYGLGWKLWHFPFITTIF